MYRHRVTFLKGQKESASELLPRVHLLASLLKRWLLGRHQGAVNREHLDYYLDEFTFRFQSTELAESRKALPAPCRAGRSSGTGSVQVGGEVLRLLAPARNDCISAGKTPAGTAGFVVSRHAGAVVGAPPNTGDECSSGRQ